MMYSNNINKYLYSYKLIYLIKNKEQLHYQMKFLKINNIMNFLMKILLLNFGFKVD
jgi:hypothetical protein